MKTQVIELVSRFLAVFITTLVVFVGGYYLGELIGVWFNPWVNSYLIGIGFLTSVTSVTFLAEYMVFGYKKGGNK